MDPLVKFDDSFFQESGPQGVKLFEVFTPWSMHPQEVLLTFLPSSLKY